MIDAGRRKYDPCRAVLNYSAKLPVWRLLFFFDFVKRIVCYYPASFSQRFIRFFRTETFRIYRTTRISRFFHRILITVSHHLTHRTHRAIPVSGNFDIIPLLQLFSTILSIFLFGRGPLCRSLLFALPPCAESRMCRLQAL